MDDVEAHVARPRDPADGVEVRPVVVHERAGAMEDLLHLLDPLVEEPERRRIREHEPGRLVVHLAAEVVEVDVAAGIRLHLDQLVPGHRHARGIRPVRRVGDDDLPPPVAFTAFVEVRPHEHETRQLALRSRSRLERHRMEAAHLGEDLLQAPHELERALGAVLLLERVEVGEAGKPRDHLVDARVVLHRAGAERIEARVDAEVPRRQLGEVPHEVGLGDLGQARRLGTPQLVGDLGHGEIDLRQRVCRPAWLRLLVDELHAATSVRTSTRRSMSAVVRFSVTATRRTSSRSP